jgi:hypothetical protein
LAIQSVYFNEIEDVLSSLDLLTLVAPLVRKQPSYWKWVIIAAHAGLQGAMVCALRAQDTSGVSVLEKKSARKMLKWFDTQKGQPPEERLADFNTLLERCSDKKFMGGEPLKLTRTQNEDIEKLHDEFRNRFAHFVPMGWTIKKLILPRIARSAVDATEMLMGRSQILLYLSGNIHFLTIL